MPKLQETELKLVVLLEESDGLGEVVDPEEQAMLDKLFDDAEQHQKHYTQHHERLVAEHEGEFALVFMDERGESQIEVGELKELAKHEGYGQPAAKVEWLGFELYA